MNGGWWALDGRTSGSLVNASAIRKISLFNSSDKKIAPVISPTMSFLFAVIIPPFFSKKIPYHPYVHIYKKHARVKHLEMSRFISQITIRIPSRAYSSLLSSNRIFRAPCAQPEDIVRRSSVSSRARLSPRARSLGSLAFTAIPVGFFVFISIGVK